MCVGGGGGGEGGGGWGWLGKQEKDYMSYPTLLILTVTKKNVLPGVHTTPASSL